MKTQSNIKKAAALIASAMLLNVSAHGQLTSRTAQPTLNISSQASFGILNVTRTFDTPNYSTADWGLSASFGLSDRFTPASSGNPYNYTVTANGTLRGKAMRRSFTAAEATGFVVAKPNARPTVSGSLKLVGVTVWQTQNTDIARMNSTGATGSGNQSGFGEFVLETSVSATIPFMVGPIPFDVRATVKPSVSGRFAANVTTTQIAAGTQINVAVGPEASVGATAEVSVGTGVTGARLSVGAAGTLRIGSAGIKSNVSLVPVPRTGGGTGLNLVGSVTLDTRTPSGKIDVFAEAEVFLVGKFRVTETIATFNGTSNSRVLAGPITQPLF